MPYWFDSVIDAKSTAASRDVGSKRPKRGMNVDARIPRVGEVLVHRFRLREGDIRAEVVSVDPETRSVSVKMNGKVYASLSAAAKTAAGGTSQNGWIYWGLKKQVPKGSVE